MLDLRLINGIVVGESGAARLDVGIEDGRIAELAEPGGSGPPARRSTRPACTSSPARSTCTSTAARRAIRSAARSAARRPRPWAPASPRSSRCRSRCPRAARREVLQSRRELAEQEAFCNVALYSGAVLGSRAATEAMVEAGAIGFKLFTISPAAGTRGRVRRALDGGRGRDVRVAAAIATTGLPCVVHAENEGLLRHFGARRRRRDRRRGRPSARRPRSLRSRLSRPRSTSACTSRT